MSYRLAKSLETLRSQVNELAPNRTTTSDGWIGDAAHASRDSDHNPWVKDGATGIVTALDLTHDTMTGADMERVTESIRRSKDPRVKYVLWNHRMYSSYATSSVPAWTWRPYSGSNPHTKHAHVSVRPEKQFYDSTRAWAVPERVTKWHLKATKGTRTKEAVFESWEKARAWIREKGRNGWKVVTRKR